jgi:hypothetical protein
MAVAAPGLAPPVAHPPMSRAMTPNHRDFRASMWPHFTT